MMLDGTTWGILLSQTPDVQPELLKWWLSDYLCEALTSLPLGETPSPEALNEFQRAAERLRKGEPVQYVSGRAPFRHLTLNVTKDVLIPRPETEQLVQLALDLRDKDACRVLDVGTGSGCIALSLKQERHTWEVAGVDISPEALAVAKQNANKYGLSVEFSLSDLLKAVPDQDRDLLIANLPYIGEAERDQLPEMVRDWEPEIALFSGATGTTAIQELLRQAPRVLKPKGHILLETGETHTPFLAALAEKTGWRLESTSDLAGRERFHRLERPT